MNWSIEQNFILLQFIKVKGEHEWLKNLTELKDLFNIHLTNANEEEYKNYKEHDFSRQYNYILATTRQECQKQGIKICRTQELAEIALKKFQSFLEQQNHRDDKMQLQLDLKLLDEGRIDEIRDDKLREMREKIYCITGEDLIGEEFQLENKLDETKLRDKRAKCLREIMTSWVRTRFSDGSIVMAGDNGMFDEEVLEKLGGILGNESDKSSVERETSSSTDSDATETLEDLYCLNSNSFNNEKVVLSFEEALQEAGIKNVYLKDNKVNKKRNIDLSLKYIPGWKLFDDIDSDQCKELDERLKAWIEEENDSQEEDYKPEYVSSTTEESITDITRKSFVESGNNCDTNALDSPSIETGASVITGDDQDTNTSVNNETLELLEPLPKKQKRQSIDNRPTRSSSRKSSRKSQNADNLSNVNEKMKKVMRNITKMALDHCYSSILLKSISEETGIYKTPLLSLHQILQAINENEFTNYDLFIERLRLFFLQMKIYYSYDVDNLHKIDDIYSEIDKQICIICPYLNDELLLSDHLFQRRESRFKGQY